jgi:hypothetical protein
MSNTISIKPWNPENLHARYAARAQFTEKLMTLKLPHSEQLDLREFRSLQRVSALVDGLINNVNTLTRRQLLALKYEGAQQQPRAYNEFQIYLNSIKDSYFQIGIQFGEFKSVFQINFDDLIAAPDTVKYLQFTMEQYEQFLSEELTYVHNIHFGVKQLESHAEV